MAFELSHLGAINNNLLDYCQHVHISSSSFLGDRIMLCVLGYPKTYSPPKTAIHLPQSPECWDCRPVPPHLAYFL